MEEYTAEHGEYYVYKVDGAFSVYKIQFCSQDTLWEI